MTWWRVGLKRRCAHEDADLMKNVIPSDQVDIVPASSPRVYRRLSELLPDPVTTAENLARVIAMDPALTGRLLKLPTSIWADETGVWAMVTP